MLDLFSLGLKIYLHAEVPFHHIRIIMHFKYWINKFKFKLINYFNELKNNVASDDEESKDDL